MRFKSVAIKNTSCPSFAPPRIRFACAPYMVGMANNFEAKHPRAKDGKFTEKRRKDSGIELTLSDSIDGKFDFLSPTFQTECEFLDERLLVDDEFPDFKTVVKEYRNSIGYHCDYYDSRGVLSWRTISDSPGEDGKPIQSVTIPSYASFDDNGHVVKVEYSPTEQQIEQYFDNNDEPLVVAKSYLGDGAVENNTFYTKSPDGKIYGTHVWRYLGGMPHEILRFNVGKTLKEVERFNKYGVSQCRYWNDDRAMDLFPDNGVVDEKFSVTK